MGCSIIGYGLLHYWLWFVALLVMVCSIIGCGL